MNMDVFSLIEAIYIFWDDIVQFSIAFSVVELLALSLPVSTSLYSDRFSAVAKRKFVYCH